MNAAAMSGEGRMTCFCDAVLAFNAATRSETRPGFLTEGDEEEGKAATAGGGRASAGLGVLVSLTALALRGGGGGGGACWVVKLLAEAERMLVRGLVAAATWGPRLRSLPLFSEVVAARGFSVVKPPSPAEEADAADT